jgi:hypothetical protein
MIRDNGRCMRPAAVENKTSKDEARCLTLIKHLKSNQSHQQSKYTIENSPTSSPAFFTEWYACCGVTLLISTNIALNRVWFGPRKCLFYLQLIFDIVVDFHLRHLMDTRPFSSIISMRLWRWASWIWPVCASSCLFGAFPMRFYEWPLILSSFHHSKPLPCIPTILLIFSLRCASWRGFSHSDRSFLMRLLCLAALES